MRACIRRFSLSVPLVAAKLGSLLVTLVLASAMAAPAANALTIATYDLANALTLTLPVTTVAPGFTASNMTATGVSGGAFANHFYFNGWNASPSLTKYFTITLSNPSPYSLTQMTFSAESTGTASASVQVRSSHDSFASMVDSFTWASPGTSVTNGTFNLSAIGPVTGSLTLRFHFSGTSDTFGFANHECPNAGCGGADVGRDVVIEGNLVPEPSTAALAGLGLAVLGMRRRRAHSA